MYANDLTNISTSKKGFKTKQHYGKCRKRVEALPKSQNKRKEFVANLALKECLVIHKKRRKKKHFPDKVQTAIHKT